MQSTDSGTAYLELLSLAVSGEGHFFHNIVAWRPKRSQTKPRRLSCSLSAIYAIIGGNEATAMNWLSNQSVTVILGPVFRKVSTDELMLYIANLPELDWGLTKPNKAKTHKTFCINSLRENRAKQTQGGYPPLNQMVIEIRTLFSGKFVSTAHFSLSRIWERVRSPRTAFKSAGRRQVARVRRSRSPVRLTETVMSFNFSGLRLCEDNPIAKLRFN